MANIFSRLFGRTDKTETPMQDNNIVKDDNYYENIYNNMTTDELTDIVQLPNGEYVMIDSRYVESYVEVGDRGKYETLVRHCDKDGREIMMNDTILIKEYGNDEAAMKETHKEIYESFETKGSYDGLARSEEYVKDIGKSDYIRMIIDQNGKEVIVNLDLSEYDTKELVGDVILENCTGIDTLDFSKINTLHLVETDLSKVDLTGKDFKGELILQRCTNFDDFKVDGDIEKLQIYECDPSGIDISDFEGELKFGECDESSSSWQDLYYYKEHYDSEHNQIEVNNDDDIDMDSNDKDYIENNIDDFSYVDDIINEDLDDKLEPNDKPEDEDYDKIISDTEDNINDNIDNIINEALEDSGIQDDIDTDNDNTDKVSSDPNDEPDNIDTNDSDDIDIDGPDGDDIESVDYDDSYDDEDIIVSD